MGRTNPTYRDFLRRYESSWAPYRRALRREHQADFDRLFEKAGRYAGAAGQQNATDPERAVVLSVLLAQERELRRLRERVARLADGDATRTDADATQEGRDATQKGRDATQEGRDATQKGRDAGPAADPPGE